MPAAFALSLSRRDGQHSPCLPALSLCRFEVVVEAIPHHQSFFRVNPTPAQTGAQQTEDVRIRLAEARSKRPEAKFRIKHRPTQLRGGQCSVKLAQRVGLSVRG